MNLDKEHIATKKKIGRLKSSDVWHIATTGGLHLVVALDAHGKGAYRTLGVGPHSGMARFIAEKAEPDLIIDSLAKSEVLPATLMAAQLPLARRLTAAFQASDPR